MSPDWPLETERLTLRPWEDGDFEAFAAIQAAPETAQWLYNDPRTRDEARVHFERKRRSWLEAEDDWLSCAGVERATGALVGDFSFHWVSAEHRTGEIGYVTAPGHKGKGYAVEGARALVDWAFREAGFHRVIGRIEPRNVASGRVLEKLGMRREALFVENEWVKGEWQSESVYAVLDREWPTGFSRSGRTAALGVHHLGIAVDDLDAAVAVYAGLFGATVEHRETVADQGVEAASLRVGGSRIELLRPLGPDTPVGRFLAKRGPGMHHVAFEVEDVAAELDRLKADGVELVDETPRRGLFGLEVAFVHPEATGGVLAEFVSNGNR